MTRFQRSTLARGTGVGAVAFLLGYLVTWILAGAKAAGTTVGGVLIGSVPEWKVVLWMFYDSHFVGTRTPEVFGPGGGLLGGGDLVDTVGAFDAEYLFAVPVVLLLLAGATVAARSGAATPRKGFFAGLTVAVGYLAIAVLGLFVATEGGIAPSPLRAIVIAGVVYPVVFGALGGLTVGLFGDGAGEEHRGAVVR